MNLSIQVPHDKSATDHEQLEKLEFAASEEQRRVRRLEISLKLPEINLSEENYPEDYLKTFLPSRLNMENREINANLRVRRIYIKI